MTTLEKYTVDVSTPVSRDRWAAALAASDGALPEHHPGWTDALCASAGYRDVSRLYEFADGTEVVLPLVARRGPAGTGGRAYSYPPAWGIGGPIQAGISSRAAQMILRDLRSLGYQQIGLRPNPLDGAAWADAARAENVLTIPRRAHVLDLSGGVDAVWDGLNKSGRRNVRLARRAGVTIEVGRGGRLLDQYYPLFLASVDRWAEHQHEPRWLARARAGRRDSLAKLRAMGHHLGENFCVVLASVDGTAVAGVIGLYGRTGHGTRSAFDRDRIGTTHAGELAYWTTIELACAAGCRTFHLGESGWSRPLARAKEKFGARPHEYVELRIERLPWTRVDTAVRSGVKRVIGFRDE